MPRRPRQQPRRKASRVVGIKHASVPCSTPKALMTCGHTSVKTVCVCSSRPESAGGTNVSDRLEGMRGTPPTLKFCTRTPLCHWRSLNAERSLVGHRVARYRSFVKCGNLVHELQNIHGPLQIEYWVQKPRIPCFFLKCVWVFRSAILCQFQVISCDRLGAAAFALPPLLFSHLSRFHLLAVFLCFLNITPSS